jgi:hypothetical protein
VSAILVDCISGFLFNDKALSAGALAFLLNDWHSDVLLMIREDRTFD